MRWPCWWVDLLGPCGAHPLYQAPVPAVLVSASESRANLSASALDWIFGKPGTPKPGLSVYLLGLVSVLILSWAWSYLLAAQKAQEAADRRRARQVELDAYDGTPSEYLDRLTAEEARGKPL